ncbi:hypothetical protein K443DRAFT_203370 [Laccaria amethystina LaAM-08-1]|uniref:Unplaced genomic scaffold K443scaffold_13, whole genome shotgun sequence n=1 Tax=Laccaria amethystina LaAM-08-1 TaxID=1095629 RepID=A0A0C9XQI1_9AGAR|nr:hypothetical protein K443DRAFT_203370 [Laccaria amethystina LaAM-08-1]
MQLKEKEKSPPLIQQLLHPLLRDALHLSMLARTYCDYSLDTTVLISFAPTSSIPVPMLDFIRDLTSNNTTLLINAFHL